MGWRNRMNSISSQDGVLQASSKSSTPQLGIEFEVGRTLTLRPNNVIRGAVVLTIAETNKSLWASTIKIKFRGEETASARVKEGATVPGGPKRVETARTIYFDISYVVWSGGHGTMRANEYPPWRELTPGIYKFEFAVKLPPVNFPPSIEGPKGFSIRYVWTPVIEGAGGSPIEGPEVITPFVPISFAPPDDQWSYKDVLYKDESKGKKPLVEVEAVLPRHVFSPGQELTFGLRLTNFSGGRITCVQCSLRKHYEGPLDKEFVCEKHERSLESMERRCDIGTQRTGELDFKLQISKRHYHVPPTFQGRHLRVYYTLRCVIQAEMGKVLTKMQYHEVIIPIAVASYAHISDSLPPSQANFPSYTDSRLGPFFFDPLEDFPPTETSSMPLSYSPTPSFAGFSSINLSFITTGSRDDDNSSHSPRSAGGHSGYRPSVSGTEFSSIGQPQLMSMERMERTMFTRGGP